MNGVKFTLFTAGFVLALAFTFSCSGDDGGTDEPSSSSAENPSVPSSSSIPGSSGTEPSSSSSTPSSSGTMPSSSSLLSSSSQAIVPVYGEPITDARDGKTYETVVIGTQTWMAENLNYAVEGSKCYSNSSANCDKYGRLYNWSTAMVFESSCNSNYCSSQIQSPHRGICPSGWHIPSNADWDKLYRFADGTSGTSSPYDSPSAGRYLKSTSGWNSGGNGTDQYGFSALPGGYGDSDGSFYNVGYNGYWWSANEYEDPSSYAYGRYMGYFRDYAYWGNYIKSYLRSVRCVQD